MKTYENIRKSDTGQEDDYTTGCLLDYPYFKENYKMIPIDFSKQQALDADSRAIQQINFTEKLDGVWSSSCVNAFHCWRSKENYFGLFTRQCKSILNAFYDYLIWFNIISIWNDTIQ